MFEGGEVVDFFVGVGEDVLVGIFDIDEGVC